MVVIVVAEWFADQQQWNYHKAKGTYTKTAKVPSDMKYTREQLDRGFNTSGLWAWSRHPNFAAEQSFWVCLYQWCCMESGTYFNWAGAGAFGYLILFQASTWLTELLSAGKYPEYKVYQERVGKFLPKAMTKSMEAPQNAKEKEKVKQAKAGKGALKR
jgi:steroid 5-alpha reductase family enzyme